MLQPKRTKFRKRQKGRVKGLAQRGVWIFKGLVFGKRDLSPNIGVANNAGGGNAGGRPRPDGPRRKRR
jgi:small subunit ribosomal protein S3